MVCLGPSSPHPAVGSQGFVVGSADRGGGGAGPIVPPRGNPIVPYGPVVLTTENNAIVILDDVLPPPHDDTSISQNRHRIPEAAGTPTQNRGVVTPRPVLPPPHHDRVRPGSHTHGPPTNKGVARERLVEPSASDDGILFADLVGLPTPNESTAGSYHIVGPSPNGPLPTRNGVFLASQHSRVVITCPVGFSSDHDREPVAEGVAVFTAGHVAAAAADEGELIHRPVVGVGQLAVQRTPAGNGRVLRRGLVRFAAGHGGVVLGGLVAGAATDRGAGRGRFVAAPSTDGGERATRIVVPPTSDRVPPEARLTVLVRDPPTRLGRPDALPGW